MPSLIKRLSNDKTQSPREAVQDSPIRQPPEPQVNSWVIDSSDLPPNPGGGDAQQTTRSHQHEGSSGHQIEANQRQVHVSPSRNLHSFGTSPSRAGARSRMMAPSLSLPAKTGRSRGAPRIRYNRTPVRFTVCGEWALKECEDHTTWANELLKSDNPKDKSVPIVDLRKSVGDGTTLVTLTEKVYGSTVPGVQEEITCKGDRTENISHCLTFLQSQGVDLAGIDADDLADGNLKSALLLVGNIRSHLDLKKGESQATIQHVPDQTPTDKRGVAMPGTVTHNPGAHGLSNGTTVRRTFITSAEDLLPGSLSTNNERQGMHETIISMTELGSNGVSQHGVDGRQDHSSNNNNNIRRSRPLSAGAKPPGTPTPKPNTQPVPGTVSNAWTTEGQKSKGVDRSSLSVEDRLKSLIGSPSTNNSTRDLHHPSQPDERWQGSRSEAILDRQQMGAGPPEQGEGNRYWPHPGANTNPAFSDIPSALDRSPGPPINRNPMGGSELRDAWNKMYGRPGRPEMPGMSRPVNSPAKNNQYPHLQQVVLPAVPSPHVSSDLPGRYSAPAITSSRTSPMGQSSSTQGQGSNSSHSGLEVDTGVSTFQTFGKSSDQSDNSPSQSTSPSGLTIGPASKYPDNGGNKPIVRHKPGVPPKPFNREDLRDSRTKSPASFSADYREDVPPVGLKSKITGRSITPFSMNDPFGRESNYNQTFTNGGFTTSTLGSEGPGDVQASIFDYVTPSEASSRSVTPPLPPLSNSESESELSSPHVSPRLQRSASADIFSTQKTPDLLSNTRPNNDPRSRKGPASHLNYRQDRKHSRGQRFGKPPTGRILINGRMEGGFTNDLRESAGDESDLPFDIEDTILTVESHDTEPVKLRDFPQPPGDIDNMKNKMDNLEGMYQDIMKVLGVDRETVTTVMNRVPRRRWSIGSSDTSSLRRPVKKGRGSSTTTNMGGHHRHHHYSHRDIKAINRRFQRLESHVVTLARSVAHLSSELRSHSAMSHELEALRKEIREVRDIRQTAAQRTPMLHELNDLDRFRGWVPSLTNPKRVNKLTKFFGQEPPLLQLFLKKLGYEKYSSNFENEHIGMIELPYMTEDRLEKIGVPMGPRLRILQEAQMCFRQENFNIYIV
ncbi:uncharacterized protein LOC110454638 isoform X2 [Mizuhopecten yessoensis]|uniref:uncharacterized protein LOC110454638 isoform X2 n=1 Tax=Mizuhopecten yessoensis TaxID=6573 RepID=UPI000B45E5E7|nr:uncharacterized protein LOC110454638 isoform X2 [Mizuhopecten yessoensis]